MVRTLLLLLFCIPLFSQAQVYTQEGEVGEDGKFHGKHTWWNEEGLKVAEVIYDADGHLKSYKTWEGGEIMDAETVSAKRDRKELPDVDYEVDENGLGISVYQKGSGPLPAAGQKVKVHYEGYLQDGTVFDSSFERGKPFKFAVGKQQVIPGFDAAVSQIPIGGGAYVYIPSALGYGKYGVGVIPPFANLWYKIEVLEIK